MAAEQTDKVMAPKDTPHSGKVKVSFGKEKPSFNIVRANIADFMVKQLTSDRFARKKPIIGS